MEDSNLPSRCRGSQCAFQPAGLGRIEISRIKHEEFDQSIALFESVIALPIHIEKRVVALGFTPFFHVMIAEYGVKVHPFFEQCRVGPLEFLYKMTAASVRVDVVTHSNDEVERVGPMRLRYLIGDSGAITVASPPGTQHRKPELVLDRRETKDRDRFDE